MKKSFSIGIVGATGAVGQKILTVLEERGVSPTELRLFASSRSRGQRLKFDGKSFKVEDLESAEFSGLSVVFFSAGTDVSLDHCPRAVKAGAVVIDNSNAFRMYPKVPLVVPEVNPHALKKHEGLISNPNCSTIQLVVAVSPIHRANAVKRIVVSTYQSVSGTGLEAIDILEKQSKSILRKTDAPKGVYPRQIGFNLFPHIDVFLESGLCREEEKLIRETQKILEAQIPVCPTAVRVPVFFCHSESVNLELSKKFSLNQIRTLLAKSPGVIVLDDIQNDLYPTPFECQDKDEVFVGRIRKDLSIKNGLNLWIVADNLRRGAATNAVYIFERLVSDKLIG